MSMTKRTDQVSANMQRLLGEIINRDIELPEDHLVTVTGIDVNPDLKNAKVHVSVLPFDSRHEIMNLLGAKQGRIQKELHAQLTMKFSPKLTFVLDEKEEKASEIERLIDEEVAKFSLDELDE